MWTGQTVWWNLITCKLANQNRSCKNEPSNIILVVTSWNSKVGLNFRSWSWTASHFSLQLSKKSTFLVAPAYSKNNTVNFLWNRKTCFLTFQHLDKVCPGCSTRENVSQRRWKPEKKNSYIWEKKSHCNTHMSKGTDFNLGHNSTPITVKP